MGQGKASNMRRGTTFFLLSKFHLFSAFHGILKAVMREMELTHFCGMMYTLVQKRVEIFRMGEVSTHRKKMVRRHLKSGRILLQFLYQFSYS
jgi:hypothetical protein